MIEVRGLTKFYGPVAALRGMDLSIPEGEIVGFLGLNGAGKSTALKILAGHLLPTAGSVTVGGVDLVAQPERLRASIGFLPEQPPLYGEMQVAGFLQWLGELRGLKRAAARQRTAEVMAQTGLDRFAARPVETLSLGYRKRLGIAQAILHNPRLVILDEPISGLDPVQIVQMRALIRSLRGEHTVLISSHILPEVQETCDQLLVLAEGRVVAHGTEEELRALVAPSLALEVEVRGESAAAIAAIEQLPEVQAVAEVRRRGEVVALRVDLRREGRDQVARAVVESGAALWGLRPVDNALEAAFMEMVRPQGAPNDREGRP